MPTVFEKPWKSKANILISVGVDRVPRTQALFQALKDALVGNLAPFNDPSWTGKWTVKGSSDGVTAGMDGVDRLTSASKWVKPLWPTPSPTSWICLQGPGAQPLFLVLAWENAFTSGINMEFVKIGLHFSKAAPTGGTTTALPTQTRMLSADSLIAGPYTAGSNNNTDRRLHLGVASDGSFYAVHNEPTRGYFEWVFLFARVVDTRPNETFPWVIWGDMTGNTASPDSIDITWSNAASSGMGAGGGKGWIAPNVAGTGAVAALTMATVGGTWSTAHNATPTSFPANDAGDPLGTRPDFHFWLTTSEPSIRGRVQDIRVAVSGLVQGGVDDGVSPTSMIVGPFWFPASEAPNMG